MKNDQRPVHCCYTLGYNYDERLLDWIVSRSESECAIGRIEEVFASLPDAPVRSARPNDRLPRVSWEQFEAHIRRLAQGRVAFNFLMNTSGKLDNALQAGLNEYLQQLADVGIERITVGSLEAAAHVRRLLPSWHITMSITYGVSSEEELRRTAESGVDAVYLDGVSVNRDFATLRALLRLAKSMALECRLYANLSCLSRCPVVREHYELFANTQCKNVERSNDWFFAGCSAVKLMNPVEWIQMPWIRPEDVPVYVEEGVRCFKLADRLASTSTLTAIASAYLAGRSPEDLFHVMERDSTKFRLLTERNNDLKTVAPMSVLSKEIPADFIDHFRSSACRSFDSTCNYCRQVASRAVKIAPEWHAVAQRMRNDHPGPVPLRVRSRQIAVL